MAFGRVVVGLAHASSDAAEALRAALSSDVEVLDAPKADGLSHVDMIFLGADASWHVVDQFVAAGYPVVLLATERNDAHEYAAIDHGAAGYVLTTMPAVALRRAILAARSGEQIFHRSVLGRWLQAQVRGKVDAEPPDLGLTLRQREILIMIAQGLSNKEIAAALGVKVATVDKHISRLLARVGAKNRAGAVGIMRAVQRNSRLSAPRALDAAAD